MRKAAILLPLIVLVIIGAFILILSTKLESKNNTLETLYKRTLWLDLHVLSIKEHLKVLLKNQNLNPAHFTELHFQIDNYHYTAVIKRFEKPLENQNFNYYFIDIFGVYKDSNKEFLQKFSTRDSFILCL